MKGLISFFLRKIPRRTLQLFSHYPLKVMSYFLRGDKYECPVCNAKYKKMMPYGRAKASRPNALCPNCLTLERHRQLWLFLNKKTNFFEKKQKMLHVAPELPFMKYFEAQHGDGYITGDLESPLAKVKMDVHSIPFGENEFDIVMCNHVLEHVEDDAKVMREFLRVLKPGGWAILQVPIDYSREKTYEDPSIVTPEEREREYWQDDHMRLFGTDYGERLKKQGFIVDEVNINAELGKELTRRYCLPKETIYFCTKPL